MGSRGDRYWWLQLAAFAATIALLAGHSLLPNRVTLDGASITLVVILAVLALAPLLESATLPIGGGFRFRRLLDDTEELAEAVEDKRLETGPRDGTPTYSKAPLFKISDRLRELITEDPALALAGLRVEMERALSTAYDFLAQQRDDWPRERRTTPLQSMIRRLTASGYLLPEEEKFLSKIRQITNQAVHGQPVTVTDAERVFEMVERINAYNSSGGFSLDFTENTDWVAEGMTCAYAHCIENMPLRTRWQGSCPLWGHDCPGGLVYVAACEVAQEHIAEHPEWFREPLSAVRPADKLPAVSRPPDPDKST